MSMSKMRYTQKPTIMIGLLEKKLDLMLAERNFYFNVLLDIVEINFVVVEFDCFIGE